MGVPRDSRAAKVDWTEKPELYLEFRDALSQLLRFEELANPIADEEQKRRLRDGLSNTVHTMVFGPGGHLYVGGYFSDAGGDIDADGIAVWNGVSWSSIGGTGSGIAGGVRDLAFDASGHPVILYVTSGGWEAGPKNDPRV